MHPTTPPPFPFLLLLSLLFNPSTTSASPAPSPIPLSSPLPSPSPHLPPPGGLSLPLHRRSSSLLRRSDPETIRSWALREKGRITGKYGPSESEGEVQKRQVLSERATTALSVARLPSTTSAGTASRTSSGSRSASQTASTTVGRVEVMNFEADLAYYATVGVGVPPQYLNTILDTGSADLWIADSTCTTSTGCDSITTLNSSSSTTAVDMNTSFSVKYGSGSASGDIWQDYVSFAGYNVSSQAFALVDTVSTDLLSGNLSGLMGLGWQPLAASGVTPFWQNLFQAGVLPFPGFAFALTRFVNVTTASAVEPGGLLTFGYLNTSLFQGEINYIDIPDGMESYWVVELEGVSLYRTTNGTNSTTTSSLSSSASSTISSASSTSSSLPISAAASTSHPTLQRTNITMDPAMVAIDTGTTLIGGPKALVEQVYAGIEGSLAATGDYAGYYSYPCAAEVNVSLTFGGVSYNMTSDDFNLGPFGTTNNVSTCLGAFFDLSLSSTSRITWVIGAAFLKNVFSVFRASPPSVGFALLSSGNSTATNIYNSTSGTPISRGLNLTQIPTGIYGPSGATSVRSATEQEITTAIQAGQTVSRLPNDGGGGAGSGAVGRRIGGGAAVGAAAMVLGGAWVLL